MNCSSCHWGRKVVLGPDYTRSGLLRCVHPERIDGEFLEVMIVAPDQRCGSWTSPEGRDDAVLKGLFLADSDKGCFVDVTVENKARMPEAQLYLVSRDTRAGAVEWKPV